jgi:hypothetical protein
MRSFSFINMASRNYISLSKNEESERGVRLKRLLVETSIHCLERFRVEIFCPNPSVSKCNQFRPCTTASPLTFWASG